MAHSFLTRPSQYRYFSVTAHIGFLLSISLLSIPMAPSRADHYAGANQNKVIKDDSQARQLEPGKPIERELAGDQSHSYKITMTPGQYLQLVVDQRSIDVVVAIFAPDGEKIGEVNKPIEIMGKEILSAIAEKVGIYRIEVRSFRRDAKPGWYEIKVEELRSANAEDRYRVAAGSVLQEAYHLQKGTLEERRRSIEKFREALELYRKATDRTGEAAMLHNIGAVYDSLGEMQKALEKYNEALPLRRAVGDRRGEAATLNNIGAVYDSLGEMQKALEKYNEALSIMRAVGDRRGEAGTLNNIGLVYWSLGEMQKALEKYNEALPICRAIGDRRSEAATLNNIGQVYNSLGEMQKALAYYNEALPIRREVGNRSGEANTLHNIGAVYYALGEMQKALEYYNDALSIRRAVGDRRGEADTLHNIGLVSDSLGERQKALEKYNEALPIMRAVGDRWGEAIMLNNIGSVYLLLGEMQKALEKYNEALPICRAIGDRRSEGATLHNIGAVYNSLGERQKALEKYNEALLLSRATGDRRGEADTLHNIGTVYNSLGERQKALEKYNEALPMWRATGDRRGEAITLDGIGNVFQSLGEMQKALEKYNEALSIMRAVGNRSSEAITLNNIGTVYDSLEEMQKALEKYNEALSIMRAVGDRRGEANTLLGIAHLEQKRGNLSLARQTIEQAIGIVESLRADIGSQELRASYFASRQEFYQSYIEVLMQMHKLNPAAAFDAAAFAVSERARARSLQELLTEARADIRQGVDSSLLERERSLQQRLTAKATEQVDLLNRKHTPKQAEALAKEIDSITAEYEEVEAQIRARSPRYAALTQPQPLSLSEIQQQILDPETLLLEYSLGENASYLFVVSSTSITSHQLPKRAQIETATRRVRDLLTAPQPRPGDTAAKYQARMREARANYWPQAAALSQMLLGTAAQQLGAKRLLIVADGALQYLPFGALPVPEMESDGVTGRRGDGATGRLADNATVRRIDGATGRNDKSSPRRPVASSPRRPASPTPLVVKHEIVNLPSASTLAELRKEIADRRPAPKTIAVIANPVFAPDDNRFALTRKEADSESLSPAVSDQLLRAWESGSGAKEIPALPFSEREGSEIIKLAPPESSLLATGFNANRSLLESQSLSQYRFIHFATHGLMNGEYPELSGLILSLYKPDGKKVDGFLRMHEIYNLNLPSDMVVLSACQTGIGKEIKGEGLVGLTRGFMYAGASRVVASLWKVDDAATAALMEHFYRSLFQEKLSPSAALRQAQLRTMQQNRRWRSPYYWAAFVLQGEYR
jgi:tetratricopeptide (TPR) repeat protein